MNLHSEPGRLALLSVSDKTGIVELARALDSAGMTLLSTGGTARVLRDHGLHVREVSEHTGFPEIMDGRVKTLHPVIHGGLLGREQDRDVMAEHGIAPIEVVVVNLYPFEQTIARPGCSRSEAVEQIDIGGPAMVRASAKNHQRVAVITDPQDYPGIIDELARSGGIGPQTRNRLAARAFAHTARYDAGIASYLDEQDGDAGLPRELSLGWQRAAEMRYGENPHQRAALYTATGNAQQWQALQGKPLSYNNVADADAAIATVRRLDAGPACAIVKHANPCGVAQAQTLQAAYDAAHACDPVSAFGGIIAFNAELDRETAESVLTRQFVEVMIAPGFSQGAMAALAEKPNVRALAYDPDLSEADLHLHVVEGGVLVQDADKGDDERDHWRVAGSHRPDASQQRDLAFAWQVVRMVKSNAIVYARGLRTLGIGAGQMSRVDSARIAAWKAAEAGLSLSGAVMASDAFFPFRDSIDAAAESGIRAVIQPGGSKRDDEVIAAADEHGMAMIFTGRRHFRH
ncbi:MAG: bifunctional phosphoribosylaminoimidazolecarboxamide formyltransferase/IMP cyclohydrolase [Xanthomonadales bacterium]|nr:bifunctional phosphoribosylaminoimidazolecarboxamide formyltransferase/IMP cyclohydrolase [Xanthomonadales bacterium]